LMNVVQSVKSGPAAALRECGVVVGFVIVR
jgi:hypothetical protein